MAEAILEPAAAPEAQAEPHNCPFYGRHFFAPGGRTPGAAPFLLIDQHGNQCAVRKDAYSPCQMEQQNQPVDWRSCPLVAQIRIQPPKREPQTRPLA